MTRMFSLLLVAAALCGIRVSAQASDALLPRAADDRWWLSGQANVILQWHGAFTSPYQGEHSLDPQPEHAVSRLLTLYTGMQVGRGTEVILDVESAGGRGVSDALGLAGFTNLDVVRNPELGAVPYLARLMVHHVVALGRETEQADRGPLGLARALPVRRLDIRYGKFSTADWFDVNAVGGDSHLQFTNWAADNNAAYDYAADTRGYSIGVEVEYHDAGWAIRAAEMLMPTVANGIALDWDLRRARGENVELEIGRGMLPGRPGKIRVLGYANHANMGAYDEAIAAARRGAAGEPSIEAHRLPGRVKYGVGVNVEQAIAGGVRAMGRWGWNEGRYESFAYTEANRSAAGGFDVAGDRWSRAADKIGVIAIVNGLSDEHREYLTLGGLGFLLGDGRLTYGAERIVEAYYTAHVWRGVWASADAHWIVNPGYNQDRGPVLVPGLRVHFEF